MLTFIEENKENLYNLARVKNLNCLNSLSEKSAKSVSGVTADTQIFMPLNDLPNVDTHIKRLEKELKKYTADLEKLEKKLSNQKFVANAPDDVIKEVNQKRDDAKKRALALENQLKSFS